jgi:hypothetical protein
LSAVLRTERTRYGTALDGLSDADLQQRLGLTAAEYLDLARTSTLGSGTWPKGDLLEPYATGLLDKAANFQRANPDPALASLLKGVDITRVPEVVRITADRNVISGALLITLATGKPSLTEGLGQQAMLFGDRYQLFEQGLVQLNLGRNAYGLAPLSNTDAVKPGGLLQAADPALAQVAAQSIAPR